MAGLQVDHPCVGHHLRMQIPVGGHHRPDKFQRIGQFTRSPSGQPSIQASHARRVGNDAVLALHSLTGAPLAKLAHKAVGDFHGPIPPRAMVDRGGVFEGSVELGHGEPVQIHQAGGVVNDQADGNPGAWIYDGHPGGPGGALSGNLPEQPRKRRGRQTTRHGLPQKSASVEGVHG
ncbi:MAG: hypothetical protein RIS76_373 [Verrucomicrobiota bacterium]